MRLLPGEIGNQVLSLIDHAHPALAQAANDPVMATKRTGSQFLHPTMMQPRAQHGKRETRARFTKIPDL
jgi:hypothetical protein